MLSCSAAPLESIQYSCLHPGDWQAASHSYEQTGNTEYCMCCWEDEAVRYRRHIVHMILRRAHTQKFAHAFSGELRKLKLIVYWRLLKLLLFPFLCHTQTHTIRPIINTAQLFQQWFPSRLYIYIKLSSNICIHSQSNVSTLRQATASFCLLPPFYFYGVPHSSAASSLLYSTFVSTENITQLIQNMNNVAPSQLSKICFLLILSFLFTLMRGKTLKQHSVIWNILPSSHSSDFFLFLISSTNCLSLPFCSHFLSVSGHWTWS